MYYLVGHEMGKRRRRARQAAMWGPRRLYQTAQGERLNQVLDNAGIDAFVEAQCASCDADGLGRTRLAPGRYFRLLLLGYFEGLDSERVARDIECWGSRFFAILTHRPGRLHWCCCGGEVRASRPLARRAAGASRGHP